MAQPSPGNGKFVYGESWSALETDLEYLQQPLAPIPTVLLKELLTSSSKTMEFYLHLPPMAQFAVFYVTTMQEESDNVQELQVSIQPYGEDPETKSIFQARNSQITIWNPIQISSASLPNSPTDKVRIVITFHNEDEGSCFLTAVGGYFY